MILTGSEITKQHDLGFIHIDPFDTKQVNPNSYDLRLGAELAFFDLSPNDGVTRVISVEGGAQRVQPTFLDSAKPCEPTKIKMPPTGFILQPGQLYLGHTVEQAGSDIYVTLLDGRSSVARLGMFTHFTAGFGDLGFKSQWTLEIMVAHPLRVYPNMRVCQVSFHATKGEIKSLYTGKYQDSEGVVASQLHRDDEFADAGEKTDAQ